MPYVYEGLRSEVNEVNLINDKTSHSVVDTCTWTTVKTHTLTLSVETVCYLNMKAIYHIYDLGPPDSMGFNTRVKIDGATVFVTGYGAYTGVTGDFPAEACAIVKLSAGAHTILLQVTFGRPSDHSGKCEITNFAVGVCSLSDANTYGDSELSGTVVPAGNSVADWLTVTASAPTTDRMTVLGQMKSYNYRVNCFFGGQANDLTKCCDASETDSVVRFFITKAGTKYNWYNKSPYNAGASEMGYSCAGIWTCDIYTGESFTFSVRVENGTAGSVTVYGWLGVVMCPWIVHDPNGLSMLNFMGATGSTFHITLEPFGCFDYCYLTAVTKTLLITGYKGVDTGWDNDVDLSVTGTGRLEGTMTLDKALPEDRSLLVTGICCIVSYIAVDTA